MHLMSRSMNIPAMQRVLMEFERQSSAMDMKEEMMSDAVDDVMDVRSLQAPHASPFSCPTLYIVLHVKG
jgi:division protein CdvB (Snf7/Vps24/ESCRT-III family)